MLYLRPRGTYQGQKAKTTVLLEVFITSNCMDVKLISNKFAAIFNSRNTVAPVRQNLKLGAAVRAPGTHPALGAAKS